MVRKLTRLGDGDAQSTPANESGDGAPERQRPRVLYVEDEDVNWRLAEKILRGQYDMARAATAREAIAALEKTRYAAILMDIQLADSDLDGIEITKLLRGDASVQRPPYFSSSILEHVPPIIFVTAYSARYSKEHLLAVGGTAVINKPVDLIAMNLSLARIIASRISSI